MARNAGINPEFIRDMLWLTAAPDHLLSLTVAADTLIRILDNAPPSWSAEVHAIGINQWRTALEWILSEKEILVAEIGPHLDKQHNSTGRNPLSGSGITEYPFYSVLTEIRPQAPLDTPFILLVGQLLLAYATELREQSTRAGYENATELPWNPLENSVNHAALAVRRLSEKKYLHELQVLPVSQGPDGFASSLEFLAEPSSTIIQSDRENLWRFLQKCWGQRPWNDHYAGGGGGSGGHKWVGGRWEVASRLLLEPRTLDEGEDPAFKWGSVDIVSSKILRKRKQIEELESDIAPDESEQDEIAILNHFPCDEGKIDLGAQARVALAKARHLKKANQLIPWSYEGLTVDEIAKLRTIIQNETGRLLSQQWGNAAQKELETLFLLVIMLWTGSDVERALQTIVWRSDLAHPPVLGLGIYLDTSQTQCCWVLRAMTPEYQSDCIGTPQQLRPLAKQVFLPTLPGLFKMVERITQTRKNHAHGQKLFKTPLDELHKEAKKWLKYQFPDGRLSLGRIAKTLWNQVYQFTGDPVIASCITAMDHPLARVRLFYTSPKIQYLKKIYLDSVIPRNNRVRKAAGLDYKQQIMWTPDSSSIDEAVGARLCPTVVAVTQMFAGLVSDIQVAKEYTDQSGFVRFHNLFTLYVVQFFAYSTSCRAIKTPFLSLKEVDRKNGLAKLADKDDGTLSKTRLVWLPEKLIRQMEIYENHLLAVRTHLGAWSEDIANEPCFFLDEENRPQWVRPKSIEPLLMGYLNVRANTHRRFLRTELIERGCTAEVVDSLMGHWYQGEEPHGCFSSFNFGSYLVELKKYLPALHRQIGLNRVIRSKLS